MRRRRFLASVGGFTAAGSVALGTGAFTSVEAERSVTVATAEDEDAFLRMEPLDDEGLNGEPTGRASDVGNEVAFNIPGTQWGENDNAEGVGLDSVYEFHDLLRVSNQGTQPVEVYSEYGGSSLSELALVNDDGLLREDPPVLGPGDGIDVGLYIDTHGSNVGEFEQTLTIVADQPGD